MKPKTISKKRRDKLCVAATAAFIKCIETQRFERAAITDRVDQVENEGGAWTYIMNGEEKVFSPVTVEDFKSIKGDGAHFQLKAIVRMQNEEGGHELLAYERSV